MSDAPTGPGTDDGEVGDAPDRGRWLRLLVAGLVAVIVVLAIVVVVLLVDQDDDATVTTAANPGSTSSGPVAPSGPSTASTGSGGSTASTGSGGGTATTAASATTAKSATTATTPGPAITSFTSSATTIACPSPDVSTTLGPLSVSLSWTSERATGVDLSVDGGGIYASYGPSGNTTITVPCDGATHSYTLTAKGADGRTVSQTISVQTRK